MDISGGVKTCWRGGLGRSYEWYALDMDMEGREGEVEARFRVRRRVLDAIFVLSVHKVVWCMHVCMFEALQCVGAWSSQQVHVWNFS